MVPCQPNVTPSSRPRSGELVFAAIQKQFNRSQIMVNRPKSGFSHSWKFAPFASKFLFLRISGTRISAFICVHWWLKPLKESH